jgi:hypothetical protein
MVETLNYVNLLFENTLNTSLFYLADLNDFDSHFFRTLYIFASVDSRKCAFTQYEGSVDEIVMYSFLVLIVWIVGQFHSLLCTLTIELLYIFWNTCVLLFFFHRNKLRWGELKFIESILLNYSFYDRYQKPISLTFLINFTWSLIGIPIALICGYFKSQSDHMYFAISQ